MNKKERRPKGLGSVYKLSGGRNKPYLAIVQVGRHQITGKDIKEPLGCYETVREGEIALLLYHLVKLKKIPDILLNDETLKYEYGAFIYDMQLQNIINKDIRTVKSLVIYNEMFYSKMKTQGIAVIEKDENNKYEIKNDDIPTVSEVWGIIKETTFNTRKLSKSTRACYASGYNHIEIIHDRKVDTLKTIDIEPIFIEMMDDEVSFSKLNFVKIVLNYIFKYCVKYDYMKKNYMQHIDIKETLTKENKKPKPILSDEEIRILFRNDTDRDVMAMLIYIYTGMRPSELLLIEKKNVFLDKRYMIGGIKTDNGINRKIPIHECIYPYIEFLMKDSKGKYLYSDNGKKFVYNTFIYSHFNKARDSLNLNKDFTPHCCRHTFSSLAFRFKLDEFLKKKIIGHSSKDLTKRVYTHPSIENLVEEVNKIPKIS